MTVAETDVSPQRAEDRLTSWLRQRQESLGVASPIGDDAALLAAPGDLAVTVDTQVEGVHFLPDTDPRVLAHRLLAVNLSDLAAVGARPAWGFLVVSGPESFDARLFLDTFLTAADTQGLTLAGGDLGRQQNLTLALTALGTRRRPGRWLRRGEARAGHRLWLGGTVGEAALGFRLVEQGARVVWGDDGPRADLPADLGFDDDQDLAATAQRAVLRHQLPSPQIELGAWLAQTPEGAAIDISDGLALDLHRLAEASGVGVRLDTSALPLAGNSERLAKRLGLDAPGLALSGGEDYVLLFTLPPDLAPPDSWGARAIGQVVETSEGVIEVGPGGESPLDPAGWDHLRP